MGKKEPSLLKSFAVLLVVGFSLVALFGVCSGPSSRDEGISGSERLTSETSPRSEDQAASLSADEAPEGVGEGETMPPIMRSFPLSPRRGARRQTRKHMSLAVVIE